MVMMTLFLWGRPPSYGPIYAPFSRRAARAIAEGGQGDRDSSQLHSRRQLPALLRLSLRLLTAARVSIGLPCRFLGRYYSATSINESCIRSEAPAECQESQIAYSAPPQHQRRSDVTSDMPEGTVRNCIMHMCGACDLLSTTHRSSGGACLWECDRDVRITRRRPTHCQCPHKCLVRARYNPQDSVLPTLHPWESLQRNI